MPNATNEFYQTRLLYSQKVDAESNPVAPPELAEGEIAFNISEGLETLFWKNSNGVIKAFRFSRPKRNEARVAANNHIQDTSLNPHAVTAEQIGLGNVDNVSDSARLLTEAETAALLSKIDKSDIFSGDLATATEAGLTGAGKTLSALSGYTLHNTIEDFANQDLSGLTARIAKCEQDV